MNWAGSKISTRCEYLKGTENQCQNEAVIRETCTAANGVSFSVLLCESHKSKHDHLGDLGWCLQVLEGLEMTTYSCSWCRIDFQNSMQLAVCPRCGREGEKFRGYGGVVAVC